MFRVRAPTRKDKMHKAKSVQERALLPGGSAGKKWAYLRIIDNAFNVEQAESTYAKFISHVKGSSHADLPVDCDSIFSSHLQRNQKAPSAKALV